MQALEEQFPREEGYQITNYSKFIFRKGDSESETCINITPLERDHDPLKGSQLVIALEPVAAKVRELICSTSVKLYTSIFQQSACMRLQL